MGIGHNDFVENKNRITAYTLASAIDKQVNHAMPKSAITNKKTNNELC